MDNIINWLLEDKKNENGKLLLDGTLSKQPCSFGKVGLENKWVTFYTLLADKYRNHLILYLIVIYLFYISTRKGFGGLLC